MGHDKLVKLGIARKAHGLKGEVDFWTSSGNDTHLEKGHKVWLHPLDGSTLPVEGREFEVEQVRRGNQVLLKLKDIPDRTALEKILPFEVSCFRDQFPELEDGEFYVTDLIGLKAVNSEGKVIGKIAEFYESPGQLIFTVSLLNGERIDLPYVDNFFPSVDIAAGTITVNLPEIVE